MPLSRLRRVCEPLLRPLLHFYWRFARGMTLGVRAVVLDSQERVFLVRHGYVAGWHLPGGGVEVGETALEALRRELREEAGLEITSLPALHGVFFNGHVSRRDHVALYVVRDFRALGPPPLGYEIVASGFFARADLPAGTTSGTQARIAEVLERLAPAERWSPMDGR